jgi:hypothetical protein
MTLCLSYTLNDSISQADYTLQPSSQNVDAVSQTIISLQSNFYQEPFKGYIIFTTDTLTNLLKYEQGTITVTDGQSNNVGINLSRF